MFERREGTMDAVIPLGINKRNAHTDERNDFISAMQQRQTCEWCNGRESHGQKKKGDPIVLNVKNMMHHYMGSFTLYLR